MRVRSTKRGKSNAAPAGITPPKVNAPSTQKMPYRGGRAVQQPSAVPPTRRERRFGDRSAACQCGSLELWRSRIRWYEWPLALGFVPLRCKRCKARFWRTRSRRAPLVWFDSALDAFKTIVTNPVIGTILLILSVAATGAGLGYLLSKLAGSQTFF
jgi:hypothetical protein